MQLTRIKQYIAKYYNACNIHIQEDKFPNELSILPLFNDGYQGLENGSGQPIQELNMINSSARLAVFYYKLLESSGKISALMFEWNKSTPLKIPQRKNPPANIDVRYETDNEIHFVESKYLEPYYSGNERIKKPYQEQQYYSATIPDPDVNVWVDKFKKVDYMTKYVNVTQLYRHLLAIYRHYLENLNIYIGKKIVLESVSWVTTERFLNCVEKNSKRSRSYLEKRMHTIAIETKKVEIDINSFIKLLNWTDCRFEVKHYNDMLDDIKGDGRFNDFCKQYFLD